MKTYGHEREKRKREETSSSQAKKKKKKIGGERIREKEIEKKKEKKKKRKRKEKQRGKRRKERGECVIREEEKIRERHFPSRSPTNRQLKRIGARDKANLHDESYEWVLETASFIALQNVGVSPTLVISYLLAM